MKLVLASTSKFKSEILNKVHLKHISVDNNFDEESIVCNNVYDYVKQLSYNKAINIKEKIDNDSIILGLDTVVYVDNKVLEKPKSIKEAKDNIKLCMNNTTKVITGITLINKINNEIIND